MLAAVQLVRNHKLLRSWSFVERFSNWYIDIKIKNRGKQVVLFYPSFLVKRWFFVLITVFVGNNSGLQFVLFINLNVATVVFYGWMTPHTTKERKWLEYFNDVMIMLLTYSMICMTSFVLDHRQGERPIKGRKLSLTGEGWAGEVGVSSDELDMKFNMGYVFMALFGILVIGNFAYITNFITIRYMRKRKLTRLKKNFLDYEKTRVRNPTENARQTGAKNVPKSSK